MSAYYINIHVMKGENNMERAPVPFEEQETSINIDYVDKSTYVYSTNKHMIDKLYKLKEKYPDEVMVMFDNVFGVEMKIPTKWIKILPPRQLSDEKREERSERMRKYWEEKKNESGKN